MKKSNTLFSVSLVLALFLMMGIASALTVNTPTQSQAINGTFLFNATTVLPNALNCTFSTTANSNFAITVNSSAGQTEFTNSSNTASLTEVADTTLTVVCRNATASESATRTISIDNTNPSCSFEISNEFISRQSGLGVSMTQKSTDTTDLTYSWVLTNDVGSSKATYTTSEPTFSNGDLEDLGEHTITLTVTDEVSKHASCTDTFLVKSANTGNVQSIVAGSEAQNVEDTGKRNIIIFVVVGALVFLLLFIVVIWYLLGESKKRRR